VHHQVHHLERHPDEGYRNLDEVRQHQLDAARLAHHRGEELHRHRLDEVRPGVERHCVMVQKDCFHPDELPVVEYPYPGSQRMDCYPDVEFQELVMEVLESEVKVRLAQLLLLEQELLRQVLPLPLRQALVLPAHLLQQRLPLQVRPRSLLQPS
jgi:hypothetical protein